MFNQFNKMLPWIILSVIILISTGSRAQIQWDTDGIKVASTTTSQVNVSAVPDSQGGFFTVYEANPSSDADIYARWIDGSGNSRWGSSGILITSAGGDQKYPSVAPDGSGGIYIAWQDEVSGDIYAQHINSSGSATWTVGGVAICSATGEQSLVKMVSDDAGGAILVWVDKRGGSTSDLYAQRIDISGTSLWTTDGVPVTTASGNQSSQVIIKDNAGGVFVTWQDSRNGYSNIDIYVQRLSSSGVQLWTPDGLSVCSASSNQMSPDLDTTGSNLVICWEDSRSGNSDIYAQAVNQSGAVLWTSDGVPVSVFSGTQNGCKIVHDGAGGAIVVWSDNRNLYDIYGQRINSSGTVLWTANGLVINESAEFQISPEIVSDNAGGALIAWKDYRSGSDYGLYTQWIDSDGSLLWQVEGLPIVTSNVVVNQDHLAVPDESGGLITVWQDGRDSKSDIYAQLINDILSFSVPTADTLWAGGQEHTIQWALTTSQIRFDYLSFHASSTPGDGYPYLIAGSVNPTQYSQSWTPSGINSTHVQIKIEAHNVEDSVVCEYISDIFTIDSDPPDAFNLLSPVDGSIVGLMPSFTWQSTTDNLSGFDHFELWIDDSLVEDDLQTTGYTLTEIQALSPGLHTWTVKAVDLAGLVRQATQTWGFNAGEDLVPPTSFHLLSPTNDLWSTDTTPTFTWEASSDTGSGLQKYQFFLDSQLEVDNISPAATSMDTLTLSHGEHAWTIVAVDSASNTTEAEESWIVKVDNVAPQSFTLNQPTDDQWTQDTTPTFSWQTSSDTGIGLAEYQLWIDSNLEIDHISGSAINVTLPGGQALSEGTHSWSIVAKDSLGNSRPSTDTFTLGVDITPPNSFSLTSPLDGSYVTEASPSFSWQSVSDNLSGLAEYELWIDGSLNQDALSEATSPPAAELTEGLHTWTVRAIDNAGNIATTTTFSFVTDTTPPEPFSLISPADYDTLHIDQPTFKWQSTTDTTSGFDIFQLYLNGELRFDNLSAQDTSMIIGIPLENGDYDWEVWAWDNAGNVRISDNFDLTIDCNPPQITSPGSATATEDIPFSYSATAVDPDEDIVLISFENYPTWLSPSGDQLIGTSVEGTEDTSFLVIATDGLLFDTLFVILTVQPVNDPPEITSPDAALATEDVFFTYTAMATDPEEQPVSFTFENYPSWLTPSENRITGTPTEGEVDSCFDVIAFDGSLSDTLTVTLTVTSVNDPPVITSSNSASGTEDVLFTYTATAIDPEEQPVTFTFENYPPWLTPSGDQISGTPTEGQLYATFRVIASDGFLKDTLMVILDVTPVNDPPVITSSGSVTATEDVPFTYTATADDPEEDYITFLFENYPSWLTPSGSQITGTPTENQQDSSFDVIAYDGLLFDTLTVTVTVSPVNDPPVITSSGSATATEDVLFTYTAMATDPEEQTVTFTFEDYPAWLTVSENQISGTPTEGPEYTSFLVIGSDGSLTDTLFVLLTVIGINDPPVVTSSGSATATEDVPFTYTATATDPEEDPLTFQFENYPIWLTPSDNQISGTPTEGEGNTTFDVIVSDGSLSDTLTVSVTVSPINDPPTITSSGSAAATEDVLFAYTATATDPEEQPITITFEDYPIWLTPSGDRISGTPTEGHSNTSFSVIASDGSLTDTLLVFVTVTPVNDPPVITSSGSATATEDVLFTYTATATDPENSPLTYTFENHPSWLTPSDDQITGTPAEGDGNSSFDVLVSDGSLSDTLTVTLTVQAVNDPPVLTSPDTVTATEDIYFCYTATATDIDNPTITFVFSNVPDWLSVLAEGIYGIPSEGTVDTSFTVIASDGELMDTLDVFIEVLSVNDPPEVTSSSTATATEKIPFSYRATATDIDGPNLFIQFANYPSWLSTSGPEISGTPNQSSPYATFDVIASDGILADTLTVILTLTLVNDPPVFSYPLPQLSINSTDTLKIHLDDYIFDQDDPDSMLTWSYANLDTHSLNIEIDPGNHVSTIRGWFTSGECRIAYQATDPQGASATDTLRLSIIDTGVENIKVASAPDEFILQNNYPNPFNPVTHIRYGIPRPSHVTLTIFNMLGQQIVTLIDEKQQEGLYEVQWDAMDTPSGIYFYQIQAGDWHQVKRMVLMK